MITDWSAWGVLNDKTAKAAPSSSAIYQVSLVHGAEIRRLLGDDPDGALYIGKSENLSRRLRDFIRGIRRGRGHAGSNIVGRMADPRQDWFREQIGAGTYRYRYTLVRGGALSGLEQAELEAYLDRFGELPPFNAAMPGGKRPKGSRRGRR